MEDLNFKQFFNGVFPLGWTDEDFKHGTHLDEWCEKFEEKPNTCIIGPRKHSKSVIVYAYLQYGLLQAKERNSFEVLYISFKKQLASYHIRKFKEFCENNPVFSDLEDLKPEAENKAKYSWKDSDLTFTVEPTGINSFDRGRHPDLVILDDVLKDPKDKLDLGVIKSINKTFREEITSLPKENGGEIKAVGTSQTKHDFMFNLRDKPSWSWGKYKAVPSWEQEEVLWSNMFSIERMRELKEELGEKSFKKEYQAQPVHTSDSYFTRKRLEAVVDHDLELKETLDTDNDVVAGWDIGKKQDPSHFAVFEIVDGDYIMRYEQFFDNWDYTRQKNFIDTKKEDLQIDTVWYDATRGEFERDEEMGRMKDYEPVNFSSKTKHSMAKEFEQRVTRGTIKLLPPSERHGEDKDRLLDQLLVVNNNLKAPRTDGGHGDSFWSIGLACYGEPKKTEVSRVQNPWAIS